MAAMIRTTAMATRARSPRVMVIYVLLAVELVSETLTRVGQGLRQHDVL